jgi:hypothetical protein
MLVILTPMRRISELNCARETHASLTCVFEMRVGTCGFDLFRWTCESDVFSWDMRVIRVLLVFLGGGCSFLMAIQQLLKCTQTHLFFSFFLANVAGYMYRRHFAKLPHFAHTATLPTLPLCHTCHTCHTATVSKPAKRSPRRKPFPRRDWTSEPSRIRGSARNSGRSVPLPLLLTLFLTLPLFDDTVTDTLIDDAV